MRTRFLTLVCALALVAGASGCVAAAVGAGAGVGTYAYVKGVSEALIEAPYNDVWRATGQVLRDYEINITSESRDALAGSYKGERHDGTNVIVDLDSVARNTTKVRVRLGAFGDRLYQERLIDDIKARL